MKVYMSVTADQYELPLLIEENVEVFCRKLGISKKRCWDIMAKPHLGSKRGYRIVRINIDELDE